MSSPGRDRTRLHSYAVVVALCILALGIAFLNGFVRGHWFRFGIAVDTVVCLSMLSLFLKERRRLQRVPSPTA